MQKRGGFASVGGVVIALLRRSVLLDQRIQFTDSDECIVLERFVSVLPGRARLVMEESQLLGHNAAEQGPAGIVPLNENIALLRQRLAAVFIEVVHVHEPLAIPHGDPQQSLARDQRTGNAVVVLLYFSGADGFVLGRHGVFDVRYEALVVLLHAQGQQAVLQDVDLSVEALLPLSEIATDENEHRVENPPVRIGLLGTQRRRVTRAVHVAAVLFVFRFREDLDARVRRHDADERFDDQRNGQRRQDAERVQPHRRDFLRQPHAEPRLDQ